MKTIALLLALLALSGCDEDAINSLNQSNQPQESAKVDGQAIEPTTDMAAGYGFPVIVFDEEIVLGGDFGEQTARLLATKTIAGTKVDLFIRSLTHQLSPTASSAVFIPTEFRLPADIGNVYMFSTVQIRKIVVGRDGKISFQYLDWNGAQWSGTTTVACSVSWFIPN